MCVCMHVCLVVCMCICMHVCVLCVCELRKAVRTQLLNQDTDCAFTVDNYVQKKGQTLKQYISAVSTVGCRVDGLFLWLAAWVHKTHVNVVGAWK